MQTEHKYQLELNWTGNKGSGTATYAGYERSHSISISGKPELLCSSDPTFRGDASRHNPEELFVASIAACHMLWYLHLCAEHRITVTGYQDMAVGVMEIRADGGGSFKSVTLNPRVKISREQDIQQALTLHQKAHQLCFIANSCNFPISHRAECIIIP